MLRQISIFFSTLIIFGMMHVSCQVRAQSPKEITNSIGMKMVLIPKGTFDMGSAATDPGADLDEPQHQVTLSRDFYIGQFEVTQSQYEQVSHLIYARRQASIAQNIGTLSPWSVPVY
ncbi:MAG: formylglycine-generating enzyme family protein [Planctomycetota bacterium]|jgi:formylglycine-generating enzyme required for sulfatase activity